MKYSKCGVLLILAGAGLAACNSDPTESFREEGEKIVATPAVVFVQQGANVFVSAQLVDDQGNQLPIDLEASEVGPGITVVNDTAFLATTNGTKLTTTQRFVVSGVSPISSSFKLVSGSTSVTVPVRVLPTSLVAAFSTPTPASNEVVTLTAEGYHFLPGTTVVIGADSAVVVGFAEDGSSVDFLPVPGSTGPATVTGAAIDFLPEAPLTLTTTETITVGATTPLAGSNAPGTAPIIATPASGFSSALFDTGSFASPVCGVGNDGVPCQLYKLSVPVDAVFDARLTWSNSADLGLYVLSADGTADTGQSCDDLGNGADGGAEECTITLIAGDYILAAVNFGPFYAPPDPAPDEIALRLTAQ